ncbi:MAG: type II CAAX endopeptidase family protein [Bacilli bacterium]
MKKKIFFYSIIILGLLIVGIPDLLKWNYWLKSGIKIIILLLIPVIYSILKKQSIKQYLFTSKKVLLLSLLTGIIIYSFIVIGYLLFNKYFDFSAVADGLSDIGITKKNFIFVFLYIPLINAFVEEFFFRGFLMNEKITNTPGIFAMILSALFFALYHIFIMNKMINPLLFFVTIAILFCIGYLFNWISKKYHSILPTYIIHMFANLAINTCALFVLGMF